MLCIMRERMQTFAYVHQIGRMRILGTMDPTDYQWKKTSVGGNGTHLEFFQYSVKLGRNLLLQSKYKCLAAIKH